MTEYINIIGSDNQEELNSLFEQFCNSLASKNIYLTEPLSVSSEIKTNEIRNGEIKSNIVNEILRRVNINQFEHEKHCFGKESFDKGGGYDKETFSRACI